MRSSKFDHKARKMIFVGYTKTTKNYWRLDISTDRIIKSCDVDFDESQMGYPSITGTDIINSKRSVEEHSYAKTAHAVINSPENARSCLIQSSSRIARS